jgi:hypothetical protein
VAAPGFISNEAKRTALEMVSARKFASAGYVKFAELKEKGSIQSRIVHVEQGQFGKLDATLESGRKVGLNGTSVGALMNEFGDDTDDWAGHEVEVYAGSVKYQGALKDAVLVRSINDAAVDEKPDTSPSKKPKPAKRPGMDDEIPW